MSADAACPAGPAGACAAAVATARRFINDDACGDWTVPIGETGLEFQVVNALSASLYVLAGLPLIRSQRTRIARAYGIMFCFVGVGSFSYHATTSLTGFLIDIVPMAVTGAMLLYSAMHVLQALAGAVGHAAETTRIVTSASTASFAVYVPWLMMAFGASHSTAWGVWALLYGLHGAIFGVVGLAVFLHEGIFSGELRVNLFTSIACVLFGLACTAHSFIPGLCQGWREGVPMHAVWHVFSALTANRCGVVLDVLTELAQRLESSDSMAANKKQVDSSSLLLRLLKRDVLPSQFSM